MIDREARAIRGDLAARDHGRGKRYPEGLRARVTVWLQQQVAGGTAIQAAAAMIEFDNETARRWLVGAAGDRAAPGQGGRRARYAAHRECRVARWIQDRWADPRGGRRAAAEVELILGTMQRVRVFAYPRPADLRKGYDGLSGLVQSAMGGAVLSGDLFLFVNRRRDATIPTGLFRITWVRDVQRD
jgi:hypothetical protein